MVVHLDINKGNWVKAKVTLVKSIIFTVGHQILLLRTTYSINIIIKVKVITMSKSFQNQIVSVRISIPKQVLDLRLNTSC